MSTNKHADLAIYVAAFFDELMRLGVREVVISPGSRSTPLAMVAYEAHQRFPDKLDLYIDVDERGAAFFALGCAKASGRAVALICTSGTAVANYYPAVMEAESSRVPLVVLSGDRPARLQQVGAPQTCDQAKIFSDHVKGFFVLPEPCITPEHIAYARQVAREAIIAAAPGTHAAGPVHINAPFDEPLVPDCTLEELFVQGRAESSKVLPALVRSEGFLMPDDAYRFVRLFDESRVIVLAGEGTLSVDAVAHYDRREREIQALLAFAQRFDAALLADPLSQLREFAYPPVITGYDGFIAGDAVPEFDVVVRFGRYPVSKRLTQAIAARSATQIVVDVQGTRDFNAQTTTYIAANPLDFAVAVLEAAADRDAYGCGTGNEYGSSNECGAGDEYAFADQACNTNNECDVADQMCSTDNECSSAHQVTSACNEWDALDQAYAHRIAAMEPSNSFEGTYINALLHTIPQKSLLFSANSMAIRALDTFYQMPGRQLTVLANRGLNGIDGTLSTAFGAAQSFEQTVLLTGDLTFIHDVNALALQGEMLLREQEGARRPSILIVVLNNQGGAIFDMLPQCSDEAYFERLFITPQNINVVAAASAFGVPAQAVSSVEEFNQACSAAWGVPGISLIEVPLPLRGVRERYHDCWVQN